MTREFNKQQRNGPRPPSRNYSSNRYGEERSPDPARPRLNRASVDRAWESGAPHHHADYRPRSSNGQAPRNTYNQRPGYSSTQGRPSGNTQGGQNRPYENRDANRRFDRGSDNGQGPRPRSFNSDRRTVDDQREGVRRGYSSGPNDRNTSRPFRGNEAPRGRDTREQARPFQGRPSSGRNDRPAPNSGRNNSAPRYSERRGGPDRDARRRPEENPRWQSRPWAQNNRLPSEEERSQPSGAQFEGDYEYFEKRTGSHPPARPATERPFRRGYHDKRHEQAPQQEERHVTRLPDGRVLKGPRPVQRKDAQFWTDITEDTQQLIEQIHAPEVDEEPAATDAELTATPETAPVAPSKKGKRVPVAREKKVAKPRSTGPRPSQRGFKWPAAE